jgi:NAD-dependent SIR2 family protein deacetylase
MSANSNNLMSSTERFLFPPWANYLVPGLVILAIGVLTYVPLVLGLFLSPQTTDVRYRPQQPLPFSHELHAGQLQMDCRYCHSTVEQTAYAAIPSTKVCMNCHASIKSESEKLQLVRESYTSGQSVSWVKIHDEPDFVFFNHAAHVSKGVGCVSCHGRIDQMETVYQHEPLSMAWCLRCHRNPTNQLRPRSEITNMQWDSSTTGKSQTDLGAELFRHYQIQDTVLMTSCTTCHR